MMQDEVDISNTVDPYKHQKKYNRNKYLTDPEFRIESNKRRTQYNKHKYDTDPDFRERRRQKARERYHAKKAETKAAMKDTPEGSDKSVLSILKSSE
ncbi:MAG: hypothetical protein EOP45_21400 [Sphingobacteriaceae bacterium]|nr:MAG: hypothetical protein EOP45_21400 [Sphingobacteriaceae bacterium]